MSKLQFESSRKSGAVDARQAQAATQDRNLVQEVDSIIESAVHDGGTEIHFEPHLDSLAVRIRVAGALRAVDLDVPQEKIVNVINRIKVLSGMDITRSKIPQTGFFKATIDDQAVELYSSVLPTLYGEAVVVRVEYKVSATLKVGQLGMSPNMLDSFRRALTRDSGMIMVTGPPGSGKRTTAYAAVMEINAPEKLAMGIDPVIKYEIPGMIQGKVEEGSEYSMTEAIKALLKQFPDIAYIGDITGLDEARAAVQGAFARRVVICRMTATDTVNAVRNFLDMGVQPFLVAGAINGITNQRMLRRLCASCREGYAADAELQKQLGVRLRDGTQFYRSVGCPECDGLGFKGVQVIYEFFRPSEQLNKMIVAQDSVQEIRQQAVREGMVPLKMDGIGKAMHGLVTVEDVLNSL